MYIHTSYIIVQHAARRKAARGITHREITTNNHALRDSHTEATFSSAVSCIIDVYSKLLTSQPAAPLPALLKHHGRKTTVLLRVGTISTAQTRYREHAAHLTVKPRASVRRREQSAQRMRPLLWWPGMAIDLLTALAAGICLNQVAGSDGERVGGKLNVHIVCHTHDDAGWLKV